MEERKIYQTKKNFRVNEDMLSKVLPQAPDMEELVLGALLLEKGVADDVIPFMTTEMFYKEQHKIVFDAMKVLYAENKPIDISTVIHKIKSLGKLDKVEGGYFVTCLTNRIASSANIEYHSAIVKQKFLSREIISKASEIVSNAFDEDALESVKKIDQLSSDLNQFIVGKDFESDYSSDVIRVWKKVTERKAHDLTGITTGNTKADQVLGGWNSPDLIIFAARPGMGKTARMLAFAHAAAIQKKQVCIFSLEMGKDQLIERQLISEAGVHSNSLKQNMLQDSERFDLSNAAGRLTELPIYINEKAAINVNYIRTVCRERKRKYGLDMVFIDYLQLLRPIEKIKNRSREQEIAEITASLKSICKELQVPIMALSQLNRELEKRADKRPILSDLRESGAIEQDADIILTLYRPSQYYQFGSDRDYENTYSENEYKRISELGLIKHRHGENDVVFLEQFIGEHGRFIPISHPF